jgi:hypothetical protein
LNAAGIGWAAGCALMGCIAGCATAGTVADYLGKKKGLALCAPFVSPFRLLACCSPRICTSLFSGG